MVLGRVMFSYISVIKVGNSASQTSRELLRDHTTILNHLKKAERTPKIKEICDGFEGGEALEDRLREKLRSIRFPKLYNDLFDLYGGRCAICGFSSVVEICHIIPRYIGGSETRNNLIVLCPNHHGMFDRGLVKIEDIPRKNDYPHPSSSSSSSS